MTLDQVKNIFFPTPSNAANNSCTCRVRLSKTSTFLFSDHIVKRLAHPPHLDPLMFPVVSGRIDPPSAQFAAWDLPACVKRKIRLFTLINFACCVPPLFSFQSAYVVTGCFPHFPFHYIVFKQVSTVRLRRATGFWLVTLFTAPTSLNAISSGILIGLKRYLFARDQITLYAVRLRTRKPAAGRAPVAGWIRIYALTFF